MSAAETRTGGRTTDATFKLFRDDCRIEEDERDINHLRTRDITLKVPHENGTEISYSFRCGCLPSGTTGFPCVLITKVMLEFPEIGGRDAYMRTVFGAMLFQFLFSSIRNNAGINPRG